MEVNTIICGSALEVLRTFPDESINCCISSPLVYLFDCLIPRFSISQYFRQHKSFLFPAAAQSCFFRFLAFAKFKAIFRLGFFDYQVGQKSFKQTGSYFVGCSIHPHSGIIMKSCCRLINFPVPANPAAKCFLEKFRDFFDRHFHLHSFAIRRVFAMIMPHTPSGFFNSYISFSVKDSCKISINNLFFHISLIPLKGRTCQ